MAENTSSVGPQTAMQRVQKLVQLFPQNLAIAFIRRFSSVVT